MKKMLCPYKVKIVHDTEIYGGYKVNVDRPEFCECDYDECYFFTTHTAFENNIKILVPECRRAQHDWEANT